VKLGSGLSLPALYGCQNCLSFSRVTWLFFMHIYLSRQDPVPPVLHSAAAPKVSSNSCRQLLCTAAFLALSGAARAATAPSTQLRASSWPLLCTAAVRAMSGVARAAAPVMAASPRPSGIAVPPTPRPVRWSGWRLIRHWPAAVGHRRRRRQASC
jgi:hypothetical protein